MLLIPVVVSGGTATSVELRNAWQRAWAQFRYHDKVHTFPFTFEVGGR